MRTTSRNWLIAVILTAALLVTGGMGSLPARAAARTATVDPRADEIEPAWFALRPITLYVQLPVGDPNGPPPPPDPSLPNADILLIAPIDATHPQDPGIVIPSPPAPLPIVVPVHDTVVARVFGPEQRANCFGVQVRPGPRATESTVLRRADPNGGATLAYALRLGPLRIPLTSAAIISVAQRLGLVTLDRSWPGYGGTCWTANPGQWPTASG